MLMNVAKTKRRMLQMLDLILMMLKYISFLFFNCIFVVVTVFFKLLIFIKNLLVD